MKIDKSKKLIFLIALIAITLTSCSGGGTSNEKDKSSDAATPTAPTISNEPSFDANGTILWKDNKTTYNKNNPNNIPSSVTKAPDAEAKIGILGTGFNSVNNQNLINSEFNTRLKKENPNTYTLPNENHGIIAAEIVGGNTNGIDKNAKIYVYDVSKIEGVAGERKVVTKLTEDAYGSYYGLFSHSKVYLHTFKTDKTVLDYNYSDEIDRYVIDIYEKGTDSSLGFDGIPSTNKLYIWPAGDNKLNSNPSLQGGLPYYIPKLQAGWLNVVGLVNKEGTSELNWENLEPLSKAGVAKNWTVTAVSEIDYVKNDGSKIRIKGSDYGAAVVAGTTGLLQEKFKGISGDIMRQTILSTATDIGKTGVDEVFGWGLLNAEKALKGPALFDKRLTLGEDYVEINIPLPDTEWKFENNISGDAGLRKTGRGSLILEGDNTYTGKTNVYEGKIDIRKRHESDIEIGNRLFDATLITNPTTVIGVLDSNGNVLKKANVVNDGTLENKGSGAIITGDYTAGSYSKTKADIDGGKLIIKGKLNIEGDYSKVQLMSNQYITAKPMTSTIIEAEGGVNGNFSNVETPEMINGSVKSDDRKIDVTVSRKNVEEYISELPEADAMRKDVAENLEASFKKLDEEVEKGNGTVKKFAMDAAQLQTMSLPTRAAILDSLSGQIYASAQALTFQHSQTVNKDLSNRLVMLGTLENVGDNAGLWVTGIGANGKLKQEGFGEGKTRVTGGQVGVDRKFGENLILGTALSYSTSKVNFDRHGGKSNADNFGISLYGRLGNKEVPYYVQGRLGAGFVDSKVERDIILGTSNVSRAKINHNDTVYSGYVETGYDVKKGNFTLTPYVGLTHDTVSRGGFTEENSQFGLTADKKTYSQTAGLVGLRVGQGVNWSNGSKSTFHGYVTHQLGFKEQDLSFEAAYTGLSNAKFTVKGIGLSKNQTWIGAGVLTEVNPRFAWYINYDGKIEKKGRNNVFTTGLRFNF